MIKRALHFVNPAYLNTKVEQLVINYPNNEQSTKTVPIEDVGMIVLEHAQISISHGLLDKLMENNAAVVTCNQQHLPVSVMLRQGTQVYAPTKN